MFRNHRTIVRVLVTQTCVLMWCLACGSSSTEVGDVKTTGPAASGTTDFAAGNKHASVLSVQDLADRVNLPGDLLDEFTEIYNQFGGGALPYDITVYEQSDLAHRRAASYLAFAISDVIPMQTLFICCVPGLPDQNLTDITAVCQSTGAVVDDTIRMLDSYDLYYISFPAPVALPALAQEADAFLLGCQGVQLGYPDFIAELTDCSDRPFDWCKPAAGGAQTNWAAQRISAPECWPAVASAQEVRIVVMDTGCYNGHECLANGLVNLGAGSNGMQVNWSEEGGQYNNWYPFFEEGHTYPGTTDLSHGTIIASTITAQGSLSKFAGAAAIPSIKVCPVRLKVTASGGLDTKALVKAWQGLVSGAVWNRGVRVISCSFSYYPAKGEWDSYMRDVKKVIQRLYSEGVLVVCSMRNNQNKPNWRKSGFPGNLDDPTCDVIGVEAMTWDDKPLVLKRAQYSTWNSDPCQGYTLEGDLVWWDKPAELMAPADYLYCADYVGESAYKLFGDQSGGNSLAVPVVAAVAAMDYSLHVNDGPNEVKQRLLANARPNRRYYVAPSTENPLPQRPVYPPTVDAAYLSKAQSDATNFNTNGSVLAAAISNSASQHWLVTAPKLLDGRYSTSIKVLSPSGWITKVLPDPDGAGPRVADRVYGIQAWTGDYVSVVYATDVYAIQPFNLTCRDIYTATSGLLTSGAGMTNWQKTLVLPAHPENPNPTQYLQVSSTAHVSGINRDDGMICFYDPVGGHWGFGGWGRLPQYMSELDTYAEVCAGTSPTSDIAVLERWPGGQKIWYWSPDTGQSYNSDLTPFISTASVLGLTPGVDKVVTSLYNRDSSNPHGLVKIEFGYGGAPTAFTDLPGNVFGETDSNGILLAIDSFQNSPGKIYSVFLMNEQGKYALQGWRPKWNNTSTHWDNVVETICRLPAAMIPNGYSCMADKVSGQPTKSDRLHLIWPDQDTSQTRYGVKTMSMRGY